MLERLKKALVESFVGAIALGWIFAQGISHFAGMFVAPLSRWLMHKEYRGFPGMPQFPQGFSLQDALPELLRSVALLVLGYFLLRWLYFKPLEEDTDEPNPEPTA
jgi:hypothetical protein